MHTRQNFQSAIVLRIERGGELTLLLMKPRLMTSEGCQGGYCWATVRSQVFLVCIWLIVCVSLGLAYVYYSKANVNAAKALA